MSGTEANFTSGEQQALAQLREELKKVEEWPPDSPVSFVLTLASRTRGKLGEKLIARYATHAGLTVGKAKSVSYDLSVGEARCEVKFSTEDPPRFQQVRDPRLPDDTIKYDYLVCISARPAGLSYWMIPAKDVSELMDEAYITVQHAMSDTKWFLPSRMASDAFSEFRHDYDGMIAELRAVAAPAD